MPYADGFFFERSTDKRVMWLEPVIGSQREPSRIGMNGNGRPIDISTST